MIGLRVRVIPSLVSGCPAHCLGSSNLIVKEQLCINMLTKIFLRRSALDHRGRGWEVN